MHAGLWNVPDLQVRQRPGTKCLRECIILIDRRYLAVADDANHQSKSIDIVIGLDVLFVVWLGYFEISDPRTTHECRFIQQLQCSRGFDDPIGIRICHLRIREVHRDSQPNRSVPDLRAVPTRNVNSRCSRVERVGEIAPPRRGDVAIGEEVGNKRIGEILREGDTILDGDLIAVDRERHALCVEGCPKTKVDGSLRIERPGPECLGDRAFDRKRADLKGHTPDEVRRDGGEPCLCQ